MQGNFHARFCSRGGGSDLRVYCNRPAPSGSFFPCVHRCLGAAAHRERYVSRIAALMTTRHRPKPLNQLSYQELQEANHLIVGSPETVIKKLRLIKDRLGIGALLLEAQAGQMSHQTTMRSIELLGREVIPALKEL